MPIDRRTALLSLAGLALVPASPLPPSRSRVPPSALSSGPPIAMLVYPEMTALDLVGPHHFLGATGARMELVTTQRDLSPVPATSALRSSRRRHSRPARRTDPCSSCPGGTGGTIAAARDPRTLGLRARPRLPRPLCDQRLHRLLFLGAAGCARQAGDVALDRARPARPVRGVPTAGRVVRDGNVITGAGVSAGLDFGLTLAAECRAGRGEGILLVSEYDPEPPFRGGSPETARPEILDAVRNGGLSRFVAEARTLRILGA